MFSTTVSYCLLIKQNYNPTCMLIIMRLLGTRVLTSVAIISGLRIWSCRTMVTRSTSSSCCSCCRALYTAQNTPHPAAPSLSGLRKHMHTIKVSLITSFFFLKLHATSNVLKQTRFKCKPQAFVIYLLCMIKTYHSSIGAVNHPPCRTLK